MNIKNKHSINQPQDNYLRATYPTKISHLQQDIKIWRSGLWNMCNVYGIWMTGELFVKYAEKWPSLISNILCKVFIHLFQCTSAFSALSSLQQTKQTKKIQDMMRKWRVKKRRDKLRCNMRNVMSELIIASETCVVFLNFFLMLPDVFTVMSYRIGINYYSSGPKKNCIFIRNTPLVPGYR